MSQTIRLIITYMSRPRWARRNVDSTCDPKCIDLLEAANKDYEVCCFTASVQSYADAFLDFIDPDRRLIQHRFYRDSCVEVVDEDRKLYIKDLRIFRNVHLKDILIVDNAVISFGAQLSNGIPVPSFQEDKEDDEFDHLIPYLALCAKSNDVRTINRQNFHLQEMYDSPFDNWIEYYYEMDDLEILMEEEKYNHSSGKQEDKPKLNS